MKLLGSTKSKITKNKHGENALHLEVTEKSLVHGNIVNNDYQQDSKVLYTFVPNKPFVSLLGTAPTNFIFLKRFNSDLITDQKSQPLEIENRISLTLVFK